MDKLLFVFWIGVFLISSCQTKIEDNNKVITVGKISRSKSLLKNGAKRIVYHFNGNKYQNSISFDARIFTYGDMFLLFLDRKEPHTFIVPQRGIKIYDLNDFYKKCENCSTDTVDFKLTEEIK